jgi:hypothetical protein
MVGEGTDTAVGIVAGMAVDTGMGVKVALQLAEVSELVLVLRPEEGLGSALGSALGLELVLV